MTDAANELRRRLTEYSQYVTVSISAARGIFDTSRGGEFFHAVAPRVAQHVTLNNYRRCNNDVIEIRRACGRAVRDREDGNSSERDVKIAGCLAKRREGSAGHPRRE